MSDLIPTKRLYVSPTTVLVAVRIIQIVALVMVLAWEGLILYIAVKGESGRHVEAVADMRATILTGMAILGVFCGVFFWSIASFLRHRLVGRDKTKADETEADDESE